MVNDSKEALVREDVINAFTNAINKYNVNNTSLTLCNLLECDCETGDNGESADDGGEFN